MDARARETGDSVKFIVIRPLSRALALYWHVNLGLAPQALCLRLLSQAKKQLFDFDFVVQSHGLTFLTSSSDASIDDQIGSHSFDRFVAGVSFSYQSPSASDVWDRYDRWTI